MTNTIKKHLKNLIISTSLVFLITLFSNILIVNAEGTTRISVSNLNPKVGEKVTVTVEGTQPGDKLNIKYSGILKLESASANHIVNGNTVTIEGSKTTLTFTCTTAGNADVIASGAQNAASSVKVKITDASATPSQPATPTHHLHQQNQL